jgi:predicted nucleotidyltransferase
MKSKWGDSMLAKIDIPSNYKRDVERAVKILKEEGCKDVYLFGSITQGEMRKESDIDIAIKGCPSGQYFNLLGKLMIELDHPVDLVNLDKNEDLAAFLFREGELIHVS